MSDTQMPGAQMPLDAEDRAAIRAFIARCEVRLSTVHRVATALLSGAGLMVLLPAVERDALVEVLRPLVSGDLTAAHLLLVVAVGASLAVPLVALWLVLRDLVQFYFQANHISHRGGEAFTVRFTLTGLQLPRDDLTPPASHELMTMRSSPDLLQLLVPDNDASRRRIDTQAQAYGGFGIDPDSGDQGRAAALLELAASRPRELLEEVAKVEYGLARHVLRIQVIVLRYAKALLALLTSAFALFAASAVVDGRGVLGVGEDVWISAILLLWAPVAIAAVTAPVRWLEGQLRSAGATHTAIGHDPELTRVEMITVRLALSGFVAASVAMLLLVTTGGPSAAARGGGGAALAVGGLCLAAALRAWSGRPTLRQLLGI